MAVPVKVDAGSSTTLGFDVMAEIGEHVPTEIAQAKWRAGQLPTYVHRPPNLAGTPFANIEVFTQAPTLELELDPDGALFGVYRQPLIIRDDTIRGELLNTMEMRVPVQVVEQVVDGAEVQMVVIEISAATVRNSNLTPIQDAFVQAAIAMETAVEEPIVIPITPPELPGVRFFPVVGAYPLSLKVYGNIDGRDPGPTTPDAVLLTQNPLFDKPPFPDVAAVAEAGIVLGKVQEELVKRNLVAGQIVADKLNEVLLDLNAGSGEITIDPDIDNPLFPEGGITIPLSFDFSPTLETIRLTEDVTVQFGTAVVRLTGAIKATIDNGPDVEADFDLRFGFHFEGGQVVATITKADIDVDTSIFQVLLAVLFGPIGLALGPIVDDAIDQAVSEKVLGESFPEDVPHRTVFVEDVAITNDPEVDHPVTLRLDPLRMLVRPDAVGVNFVLTADADAVDIPVPTYFIGHRKNKEVHVAGCQFAAQMSPSNQVRFVRATEAVEEGYDGCRLCLPQFDGKGAAFLTVSLNRPAGFGQKRTKPITITGTRLSSEPTTLPTTFSVQGKIKISNEDGYWFDLVDAGVLAQGTWSVTVVDQDGWTATKAVVLLGGDDKKNRLDFRYGVDAPPIGPPIGGLRLTFKATKEQAAEKELSPSYFGDYKGTPDGTLATSKWTTHVGGMIASGHAILHRDVPFLRPGQWQVRVWEHGKEQFRTVEVKANELTNVVFERT